MKMFATATFSWELDPATQVANDTVNWPLIRGRTPPPLSPTQEVG